MFPMKYVCDDDDDIKRRMSLICQLWECYVVCIVSKLNVRTRRVRVVCTDEILEE